MRRGSHRASADAPAIPPQDEPPRPVRRTRAGTRRTSAPRGLLGADSKLATSRRRPVDAQARPAKLPVRNRQEFSPHLNRNARVDHESADECPERQAVRVPTRQRHRPRTRRPAQFAEHARGQSERAAQSVSRAPIRSSRPRDADPWMRKHAPPSWPVRNRQEFSAQKRARARPLPPSPEVAASETHAKPYGDARRQHREAKQEPMRARTGTGGSAVPRGAPRGVGRAVGRKG